MSVSNYKNYNGGYILDKLDNIVYLLPHNMVKIVIDDGEAYVQLDDEPIVPLMVKCFNPQLTETDELDERYAFTHTLTFSINEYANVNDFRGRYYCVVKTIDGDYWLVNPEFPSKCTYIYTLSATENKTDFTFATVSNHPVLRIRNFDSVVSSHDVFECKGYQIKLNNTTPLLLNEKLFSLRKDDIVYYTNDGYKEIEFNKNSLTFQEQFDGDLVSHSLNFRIRFDDYKSSWQYNLLEFTNNTYTAIIRTADNHYLVSGFETGYKPLYTINADSNNTPNNIEIQLIEGYNSGSFLGYLDELTFSEIAEKSYKYTSKYNGWECVGLNLARYLLAEEIDAFGNKTGNYKCREGYESQFPTLNIVGTFTDTAEFVNPNCSGEECSFETSLQNIKFNSTDCKTFTLRCSDNWTIRSTVNYITVTPSSGLGDRQYEIEVCNTRQPSQSLMTSQLVLEFCDESETYNVYLQDETCLPKDEYEISADGQYLTVQSTCCVASASDDDGVLKGITITNNGIRVYVPENESGSLKTHNLNVRFCDGSTAIVTIEQGTYYEQWLVGGYVCDGGNKYEVLYQYTGSTPSISQKTGKTKRGAQVVDTYHDCDVSSRITRWYYDEDDICVDGGLYQLLYEQESFNGGINWQDTGQSRLGNRLEDVSGTCAGQSHIILMPNVEKALVGCDDKLALNLSYYIYDSSDMSKPPITASSSTYYVRFKGDTQTSWTRMSYESPTKYANSAYTSNYSTQDNPIQYFDVQLIDAVSDSIIDRRTVNASYDSCAVLLVTDTIYERVQGSVDAVSGTVSSHTNSIAEMNMTMSSITHSVTEINTYIDGDQVWKTSAATKIDQTASAITHEASARLSGDTQLDSRITQTASAITQEVSARTASYNTLNSKIDQTASSITANLRSVSGDVASNKTNIATISATTSGITSQVSELSERVNNIAKFKKEVIIDLTSLNENTYYPVGANIPTTTVKIQVWKDLDQANWGYASWGTHRRGDIVSGKGGAFLDFEETVRGSGWGTTRDVGRNITKVDWNYTVDEGIIDEASQLQYTKPIGKVNQCTQTSIEFVYLRGGMKYRVTVLSDTDSLDNVNIQAYPTGYTFYYSSVDSFTASTFTVANVRYNATIDGLSAKDEYMKVRVTDASYDYVYSQIQQTTSSITSTVRELAEDVSANTENISRIQQTTSSITSTVSSLTKTIDDWEVGGRNLIMNGAFLQPLENNIPLYWENWGSPTIREIYTDSNGKKWMHVRPNSSYSSGKWQGYHQTHWSDYHITIDGALTYTLSFTAYAPSTTRAQAVFHWMKGGVIPVQSGSYVQSNFYATLTSTPQQFKFTFIPDEDSGYLYSHLDGFDFMIGSSPNDGYMRDIYITDIMFEKASCPSNWVPSIEEQGAEITAVRSEIQQTATSITASIYDQLNERTGIDVLQGEIHLDAENTFIHGNLNLYDSEGNGLTIYDENGFERVNIQSDSIGEIAQMSGDTYENKSVVKTENRTNFSGISAVSSVFSASANSTVDISNISLHMIATSTSSTIYPTLSTIPFKVEILRGSQSGTVVLSTNINAVKVDNYGNYKYLTPIRYIPSSNENLYVRITSLYNRSLSSTMSVTLLGAFVASTAKNAETYIGKDGMYVHAGSNKLLWVDDTQVQMRYDYGGLRIINENLQGSIGGTIQTIAGVCGQQPNYKPIWLPLYNYTPLFSPSWSETTQYITNVQMSRFMYKIDPINDNGICMIHHGAMSSGGTYQESWVILPRGEFTYEGTNASLPVGYTVTIVNNTYGSVAVDVYVTCDTTSANKGYIIDARRDRNLYCSLNSNPSNTTFIYLGYIDGVDLWREMDDTQ